MNLTIEPAVICALGITLIAGPTIANMVESKAKNAFITTTCKIIQLVPATLIFLGTLTNTIDRLPFSGNALPLSIGAACLSIPILFQVAQRSAQRHGWTNLHKALVISEKIFMLAIKVANISALILMSLIAWQAMNPIWITSCVSLIVLNGASTIFCTFKHADNKLSVMTN